MGVRKCPECKTEVTVLCDILAEGIVVSGEWHDEDCNSADNLDDPDDFEEEHFGLDENPADTANRTGALEYRFYQQCMNAACGIHHIKVLIKADEINWE